MLLLEETAKKFTGDQTHLPTPDFIVEILSKSTEKIDRGIKFTDYQQHGVSEYWLVDPEKKTVEQYLLENGEYSLKAKADGGTINCYILEGLTVEVEDIFR
ncbi:MAG: hypothetical protein Kapaf2KO_06560 [Candidatus Kapaibacteriales bacterium]